jgi:hypothetical protein
VREAVACIMVRQCFRPQFDDINIAFFSIPRVLLCGAPTAELRMQRTRDFAINAERGSAGAALSALPKMHMMPSSVHNAERRSNPSRTLPILNIESTSRLESGVI